MPGDEPICFQQKQHRYAAACGKQIADEHHLFLIPPVAERSGENAHRHIGRIGTDGQKGSLQSRTRLFIQPQCQREIGHGAPKRRKGLRAPENEKRF
jgi:hypothetical protein